MVSRLSYLAAWALALLPLNVAALPPPAGQQGHPGGPPGDSGAFNLQPFQFNISDRLPRMYELLRETKLPDEPQYPGVGATKGIDLDVLKSLRDQWLNEYNWEQEQEYLNSFNHYTATIDNQVIHFLHHPSKDPNAIPILLSHGWPGSFMEFLPVIEPLTGQATTESGEKVSFHVVIPSLPGFAFSSSPPGNWTLDDTARAYNTLMTEVLGYKQYAVHGTSNGAILSFTLYDEYNTTARAAHFPLMPFYSTTSEELSIRQVTLSPMEQEIHERSMEWTDKGTGYFLMHIYRPNTIGLGLYDHPLGQLAWTGEKWLTWADPNAGTGVSQLNHNEILRSVTLTYLTNTFISSVYTYSQDTDLPYIKGIVNRAHTDAPMFVTFFRYSIGFWPESVLRLMGNLVQYRIHETGGFFAGLENAPALVADLREIRTHWGGRGKGPGGKGPGGRH